MSGQSGPNVKKLIATKVSRDAIPTGGGLNDGLRFLTKPGELSLAWRNASRWVEGVITAVRSADEPNEWKDATDEEIAAEILRRLDAQKRLGDIA